MDHVRKALSNCKYPRWAIDKVKRRLTQLTSERNKNANTQDTAGIEPTTETKTIGHIVISYTQGLCDT